MPGIVCAIRGGPHSQPTIRQAITIAKAERITLHYLYVVNLDFLEHSETSRTHVILEDMREMGEFICMKAQIEARREGVEAEIAVREGNILEEIIKLSQEVGADFIVLGRPHGVREGNTFDLERLNALQSRIEGETSAKVIYPVGEDEMGVV